MCSGRQAVFVLFLVIVTLAVLTTSGCVMLNYVRYTDAYKSLRDEFEENPTVAKEMQLKPRDTCFLSGEIIFKKEYKGPVLLVVLSDKFSKREVVVKKILYAPVKFYSIFLLEGTYDLYFFLIRITVILRLLKQLAGHGVIQWA